ncbi:FUSC family protein [Streptomyces beihaiensis]|uniref:FUSC family protein n=1 Tax=Streptomyces beihaiensis TaxID=2984495 RepID=A0ABT3U1N7_9ACTN|nr:FUSC family protein [Streptomyces beihaiensis]MCX3063233.1 FUSC family protein [Streptomyces beihaiensis]
MSWFRALKDTTRSGLTVERKRLEPLIAVRGAAGLAIVIAVSLTLFGPAVAAGSAFGAYQAAIATFQRSWRPRPELAFASGASLAVSTFLGYLTGSHLFLFLALLAVWTYLAGLAWAAGPTIGLIASSNVAMMLVTITLPTSVEEAAAHAGMMVFGGLVQAALVVLFPVRRWGAHRDALADALAAEADYARRLRHDPLAPFDPQPLMLARNAAALTPRQARTRPAQLHGARGLAERIRPVLASLADPAVGVPEEGPERARVRELLGAAGAILDAAARAIRHGTPVTLPPAAVAAFRTPDTGAILSGPAKRAADRLGSLLGDVMETAGGGGGPQGTSARTSARISGRISGRTSGRTSGGTSGETSGARPGGRPGAPSTASSGRNSGASPGRSSRASSGRRSSGASSGGGPEGASASTSAPPQPLHRPGLLQLVPAAVRAMRREAATRDSPVLRHATRVTAVATVGYLIGHALPFGHGYWAPMSAVMVMRPDFSQTYSRAVARFGGTLIGVALATGVVQLVVPGTRLSAALAVLCAGLMYLLMRTGQLAAQACVGAYVVFLLGMGGQTWDQTVPERVVLTLVGGVLAMISYALYPAWETPRLRAYLAAWLTSVGEYAATVVDHYAHPAGSSCPDVRAALLRTRDARAAWQTAAGRARTEPVRHRGLSHAAADDAEHALLHLGRVAMLMEAHLPERDAVPVPAAAALADALRTATREGARAIRERREPCWTPVAEALAVWDGEGVPDRVVRRGAGLLLDALEDLSDALDDTDGVPPKSVAVRRG